MEVYTISGAPAFGATACPPGWTPTPNGNCGGPPPSFAHKVAADLQHALRSLGQRVNDPVLTAVALDGVIGPQTVTAVNRAFTVHIGEGQAPAALRTGKLGIADVAQSAGDLTIRANEEVLRRGGAPSATPPIKVAMGPAQMVPTGGSRAGMWALVGFGVLAAGVGVFLAVTDGHAPVSD